MVLAKNDFDFLVNSYYQAYGLTKNMSARGMFGNISLLPEVDMFRENLKVQPLLYETIIQADKNGQQGQFEINLIKLKLTEIYGVEENWINEIEESVNMFSKENSDMSNYRINFQTASDTLYRLVGAVIPNMDKNILKNDAIEHVTSSVLNQNHWQGDDIIQQINFSRLFKKPLFYSDNWIYVYMKCILRD